ncbi:hypothetical protein CROQUDRAFT_93970 [Cronartium quercuum f. sp. fusiforme G11]|uniref:Uncharacterized protein n=1 Tax=Cronartium quercuum f. sp. fusiforme G11 TaxID=708437 RepID=A0A9P6TC76_9BASI|nr:hypothetical protein CROQUDRAFT_93970 [Cronartium quercuum f. sp. fusiforme G11]
MSEVLTNLFTGLVSVRRDLDDEVVLYIDTREGLRFPTKGLNDGSHILPSHNRVISRAGFDDISLAEQRLRANHPSLSARAQLPSYQSDDSLTHHLAGATDSFTLSEVFLIIIQSLIMHGLFRTYLQATILSLVLRLALFQPLTISAQRKPLNTRLSKRMNNLGKTKEPFDMKAWNRANAGKAVDLRAGIPKTSSSDGDLGKT